MPTNRGTANVIVGDCLTELAKIPGGSPKIDFEVVFVVRKNRHLTLDLAYQSTTHRISPPVTVTL